MSIFGKIKDAIFGKKAEAAEPAAPSASATAIGAAVGAATSAMATAAETPAPISEVDVEAILSAEAAKAGQDLNWRTSIVDLMKALDIDSSLSARKELAKELKYDGDTSDSAKMNIWLHKQVMTKLAANGGKLPDDLKH